MAPSARLSAQGNVGFAAGGIHSGGHELKSRSGSYRASGLKLRRVT